MKHVPSLILITCIGFCLTFINCRKIANRKYRDEVSEHKMQWDGYERKYFVHLPPEQHRQKSLPVLFNLHGGGGTALGNIGLTFGRFNDLADRDGFIVVYPEAIDKNWNDGRELSSVKAWEEDIDDVGFIVEIISELEQSYDIDRDRIFTTGMSNGGFMSSRLLCDRADIFRGGAILTATLSSTYLSKCNPSEPTAVMVMNGTADELVPYDGGEVMVFNQSRGEIISTSELVEFWKTQNNCTTLTTTELPDNAEDGTTITVDEYEDCSTRGALVLYTIHGGGHTWPGGKQYLGEWIIGKTSREIVACDVIWEYFSAF